MRQEGCEEGGRGGEGFSLNSQAPGVFIEVNWINWINWRWKGRGGGDKVNISQLGSIHHSAFLFLLINKQDLDGKGGGGSVGKLLDQGKGKDLLRVKRGREL